MRVVAQQEAEWRERERRAGAKRLSKLMMISRIFMAFLILLKKSIKTSMKNYYNVSPGAFCILPFKIKKLPAYTITTWTCPGHKARFRLSVN